MTMTRRSLITGLVSLVTAPAIVRVVSIMPVKQMPPAGVLEQWIEIADWSHSIPYNDEGIRMIQASITKALNIPLRYLLPPEAKTPQEQADISRFYASLLKE